MFRYLSLIWIVAVFTVPSLGAPQQEEPVPETPAEESATPKLPRLPEPLNQISGNFKDLEKSGHFKIVGGEYGRTQELRETAMIWTVEVVKPVSCGHAIIMLKRMGDVRFYRTCEDGYQQQLMSCQLYYSSWVDEGAVSHEVLGRDVRFKVWLLMSERQIYILEHEAADTVVFAVPKRREPVHKDLWRETRRYRLPEAHSRIPGNAINRH